MTNLKEVAKTRGGIDKIKFTLEEAHKVHAWLCQMNSVVVELKLQWKKLYKEKPDQYVKKMVETYHSQAKALVWLKSCLGMHRRNR